MANSVSTANTFGHPVHPMLIPVTIAFLVATLVSMWRSGKADIPFGSPPQFGSLAQVSLWQHAMRYAAVLRAGYWSRLRLPPKVTPKLYGQMERNCAEARQPDR